MAFVELVGVVLVGAGILVLARPMAARNFPSAAEWKEDPDAAEREQRAYAAMSAFFMILTGLGLIAAGLLGVLS